MNVELIIFILRFAQLHSMKIFAREMNKGLIVYEYSGKELLNGLKVKTILIT